MLNRNTKIILYLFSEFFIESGLSKKSNLTYRGILGGSIVDILFKNESIIKIK